jgi:hypothetical protein
MHDEPKASYHTDSAHGCCGGEGRRSTPVAEEVTAELFAAARPSDAHSKATKTAGSCCGGHAGKHAQKR